MKTPMQILLVEDQCSDAEQLHRLLCQADDFAFHLTRTDRLKNALPLFRKRAYDLCLLSLQLTTEDGLPLFKELLQLAPGLPIVILAGRKSDRDSALEMVQQGAEAYIDKDGLETATLVRALMYAVERHGLHHDLQVQREMAAEAGERLYALVEHNSDAILVVDEQEQICFANPAAEKLLDCSNENLLGSAFNYPLATGSAREIEFLGPGGLPLTVESQASAIVWDDQPAYLVTLHDITSHRQLERRVNQERSFLQSVIDGVVEPVIVSDLDCRIRLQNHAAGRLLHQETTEERPLRCQLLVQEASRPCQQGQRCPLEEVRSSGRSTRQVHSFRQADGKTRFYEIEASPMLSDTGQMTGVIEAARDITSRMRIEHKLRTSEQRMKQLALHDTLTGLPNRLLLRDRLEQAMAKSRRSGVATALLYLDLDRFKEINDSLGHAAGDQYLQQIAARLRGALREGDTVARLGGDELAVLLEQVQDLPAAEAAAKSILQVLSQPLSLQGQRIRPSASIGVSLFPRHGETVDDLIKSADMAMFQAKVRGRGRICCYTAELSSARNGSLQLETALRQAISANQLQVHYQPQFRLQNGLPAGLEALVRWQHPERGLISPAHFIPLAEESGLIVPLGEWVLLHACRQHQQWLQAGMRPLRLAVNISPRQFQDDGLVSMVSNVLAATELPASCLELEITESSVMNDIDRARATMRKLQRLGVHLAIDDFGSGYSSLNCLKQFPFSKLKIDRSFIQDLNRGVADEAITKAIISLAHSLHLETVAEGVETETQASILRHKGCLQAQGFLFSRPLQPQKMTELSLRAGFRRAA